MPSTESKLGIATLLSLGSASFLYFHSSEDVASHGTTSALHDSPARRLLLHTFLQSIPALVALQISVALSEGYTKKVVPDRRHAWAARFAALGDVALSLALQSWFYLFIRGAGGPPAGLGDCLAARWGGEDPASAAWRAEMVLAALGAATAVLLSRVSVDGAFAATNWAARLGRHAGRLLPGWLGKGRVGADAPPPPPETDALRQQRLVDAQIASELAAHQAGARLSYLKVGELCTTWDPPLWAAYGLLVVFAAAVFANFFVGYFGLKVWGFAWPCYQDQDQY